MFLLSNSPSCHILDRFSGLPDDASVDEDDDGRVLYGLCWNILFTDPSLRQIS